MRASLLLLPLLADCAAPNAERLYLTVRRDLEGVGGLDAAVLERQERRYAKFVSWSEEGLLETAEDHLWAAAALSTSDLTEHLTLAQALALKAAEMGEERAFTVQALATDRLLWKQGLPQRYGTQIVYEPVLQEWRLYEVDPLTTDEVRKAMGVPPLAELLANVEELNQGGDVTEALRRANVEWPDPTEEPSHATSYGVEDDR